MCNIKESTDIVDGRKERLRLTKESSSETTVHHVPVVHSTQAATLLINCSVSSTIQPYIRCDSDLHVAQLPTMAYEAPNDEFRPRMMTQLWELVTELAGMFLDPSMKTT